MIGWSEMVLEPREIGNGITSLKPPFFISEFYQNYQWGPEKKGLEDEKTRLN
jgi:hypothetical protein